MNALKSMVENNANTTVGIIKGVLICMIILVCIKLVIDSLKRKRKS